MFGFPRLKATVGDAPGGQALIDRVLAEVEAFTGPDAEQEDDITMVALQRSAGVVLDEFDIPSEVGNERGAMDRVEQAVRGLKIDTRRLENLKTAVAEATMNAMEHGNAYQRNRPVTIRVLYAPDALRVQVTDRGDPAALSAAEAPDIEKKLAGEQSPRGWGLFLIENLVDEARVTSMGGKRTLELVLRLGGGNGDT
jgi:anti-sigma regulatory factor (Ser/Thr protein kinase)